MLSVQSPAAFDMSPTDAPGAPTAWLWRAAHLPTPPESAPTYNRAAKHQYTAQLAAQAHEHDRQVTLPPFAHLDRHWPSTSPLTSPDDDMHSSPLWRDQKAGPSRLHSPLTANTSPLLASPSPSPIDEEEEYEHFDSMYDEQPQVKQEWNEEWAQPMSSQDSEMDSEAEDAYAFFEPSQRAAEWVTDYHKLSAHFIAEKTCEMVCYLWFSESLRPGMHGSPSRSRRHRATSNGRSPVQSLSNANTATLQFYASPEFVAFMQKLLETTQVSQSVIVLSLHYIYRLKERNDFAVPKPGSEFRVAVCALMLANKFVDDNTYTNRTWSDVSSISLEELNKMEREFLQGVGFCLFVDETTYNSWLSLLKGLVLAKEREHLRWRTRATANLLPPIQQMVDARNGDAYSARQTQPQMSQGQRARSSSPHRPRSYSYAPAYPFTFAIPSQVRALEDVSQSLQASPVDKSGDRTYHSGKRTAADAFSPTSATFVQRASKRPTGLAVDINAALASVHPGNSNGLHGRYTDSLHSLERMSLSASTPGDAQVQSQRAPAHTLAAEYHGADAVQHALPQHLYFYALSSSPVRAARTENASAYSPTKAADVEQAYYHPDAERKAKLRYTDPTNDYSEGYARNYSNTYVTSYGQQTSASGPANPALAYPTPAAVSRQYNQPIARMEHVPSQRPHNVLPPLTIALSLQDGQHASSDVYAHPSQVVRHGKSPDAAARWSISASPVNPACGCAAESAYCTPPSSGAPYSRHHTSAYHHHLRVPAATPSVAAAPSQGDSPAIPHSDASAARHAATYRLHSSYAARRGAQPERAAFANAGPAGVAHFYQSSPYPAAGHGHVASAGAVPAPAPVSVPMVPHSANVSPSAWAYAGRGRRL